MIVSADHIQRTVIECCRFLRSAIDADWTVAVPDLEMTVAGVVAHAAEGCLWYAIDLAAGGKDLEPVEHRVKYDVANEALIDTMEAYAAVVASVIGSSSDETRGFHPMGAADRSGFAAMTCDELLIHTDDAARGLGLSFRPGDDVSIAVLARLFPWLDDVDDDPWELLRWANGRIDLGDRKRLDDWAWHCAPLSEWDGTIPTRSSALAKQ
ncbi:MAG: hypothetical protein R2770_17830 [Acidimicrobiales bacterium]|nr:hypothetical protein [Acidimicrobiales bacterium]